MTIPTTCSYLPAADSTPYPDALRRQWQAEQRWYQAIHARVQTAPLGSEERAVGDAVLTHWHATRVAPARAAYERAESLVRSHRQPARRGG